MVQSDDRNNLSMQTSASILEPEHSRCKMLRFGSGHHHQRRVKPPDRRLNSLPSGTNGVGLTYYLCSKSDCDWHVSIRHIVFLVTSYTGRSAVIAYRLPVYVLSRSFGSVNLLSSILSVCSKPGIQLGVR